jgi:hypothetical protein
MDALALGLHLVEHETAVGRHEHARRDEEPAAFPGASRRAHHRATRP